MEKGREAKGREGNVSRADEQIQVDLEERQDSE